MPFRYGLTLVNHLQHFPQLLIDHVKNVSNMIAFSQLSTQIIMSEHILSAQQKTAAEPFSYSINGYNQL